MNFKKIIWVVVTFLNINYATAKESIQDEFNAFCSLVEDAMVLDVGSDDRLLYIQNNIHSKNVEEAFDLIIQISSSERYQVFKQAIEHESGQSWECSALDIFLS